LQYITESEADGKGLVHGRKFAFLLAVGDVWESSLNETRIVILRKRKPYECHGRESGRDGPVDGPTNFMVRLKL
jgi:hypothetical protein